MDEDIEAGPITDWIERYYEEKLDKRDKNKRPNLSDGKKAMKRRSGWVEHHMSLN